MLNMKGLYFVVYIRGIVNANLKQNKIGNYINDVYIIYILRCCILVEKGKNFADWES